MSTVALTTLAQAALHYAGMGIKIFPVYGVDDDGRCDCGRSPCGPENRNAGKHPITSDGFLSATNDREQVEAWWTQHPNANIGTPDFDVVDYDKYKAGAEAAFAPLKPLVPRDTPASKSGGGGVQLFFKAGTLPRGPLGPSIDSRYAGANYVILPPSKHRSGENYEWAIDLVKGKLRQAPAFPLSSAPSGEGDNLKDRARSGDIIETDRNKAAFRYACSLARWSDDEELIREQTQAWVDRHCRDPHEVDVPKQVRGAMKKAGENDGPVSLEQALLELVDTPSENGSGPAEEPGPYVKPVWTGASPPALALEPDILGLWAKDIVYSGVAGEDELVKLTALAMTSRLLPSESKIERPVNIIVKGTSSTGKSFVVGAVAEFLPPHAVIRLTSMSSKSMYYDERDWSHCVLFIGEYATIAEDQDLIAILRELTSEKTVAHLTVDGDGKRKGRLIEKDGPISLVITTTLAITDTELETRVLMPRPTDTPAQTRDVVIATAQQHLGKFPAVNKERWIEYQLWLEAQDNRVTVPYADKIAQLIPVGATRIRRDFASLICLIQTHALMHQATRKRDRQGRIIATRDDYLAAREVVDALFAEGADAHVPRAIREAVEKTRELLEAGTADSIGIRPLADALEIGRTATYDRVKRAVVAGYLINVAEKGWKLALGAPLPGDAEFLPTAEAIEALSRGESSDESASNPVLEPENAVRRGSDTPPASDRRVSDSEVVSDGDLTPEHRMDAGIEGQCQLVSPDSGEREQDPCVKCGESVEDASKMLCDECAGRTS